MSIASWAQKLGSAFGDRQQSNRDRAAIDGVDAVNSALEDARLLVAFAAQSRRGIKLDEVKDLFEAMEAVEAKRAAGLQPMAAELTKFWISYDKLAVVMAPLSARSIRASARLNGLRFPAAFFTSPSINAVGAVLVFYLCLVLQAFWVAGHDLITNAELLEKQKQSVIERRDSNNAALKRAEYKLQEKQRRLCGLSNCEDFLNADGLLPERAIKAADQSLLSALRNEAETLRNQVAEQNQADKELSGELFKLTEQSRPLEKLLSLWHDRATRVCKQPLLGMLCPVERPDPKDGKPDPCKPAAAESKCAGHLPRANADEIRRLSDDIEANKKDLESKREACRTIPAGGAAHFGPCPGAGIAGWRALRDLDEKVRQLEADLRVKQADNFRSILVEVKLIAANSSAYLIAMAMGVLGALTFVLRTLSQQLRDHTYVPVSISIGVVRVVLGAIAGVFGSLLLPNGEASLKNLPPLFIPFVFGYGIEILFSLLDKVVRTFTQPENGGALPPRAT
jgi:hypothetical protein